MRIIIAILLCTAMMSLVSCKANKRSVKIKPDVSFSQEWGNKTEFEETQDYVKNLDFSLLNHPKTHPVFKDLLSIVQQIIEGGGTELIPEIEAALNRTEHETIKTIYLEFVYELLVNEGKNKAAVSHSPHKIDERKEVLAFSQFPEESYVKAPHPIVDLHLEKSIFDQALMHIKVNDATTMGLFDTGAEVSLMSRGFAERLGVPFDKENKARLYTVNKQDVFGYPAFVEKLLVGNILVKNHPVLILEDENLILGVGEHFYKYNFIIGWPLIKNICFQLDFKKLKYTADFSEKKEVSFKNLFWLGHVGLKLNTTNGQSLLFALDTGLNETELKTNSLKKMDLGPLRKETMLIGGLGGLEKMTLEMADKVSVLLANHKITFDELSIRENLNFFFIAQDGTIGADIFKDNIITIDFNNGIFKMEH